MSKTAFLFPGQGSQTIGMAKDIYDEFDYVRELFDMAEETVKINLSRLCFKGPMSDLTQTVNLQPAITVASLGFLLVLEKEGFFPDIAAGHSLGEYGALCAAKVLTKQDTMRVVHVRGSLMHRESLTHKGAMSAIIGLEFNTVKELVSNAATEGIVSIANHNSEYQIVITGDPPAVKKASDLAREKGARAIPLKVSGAWHSQLIKGAVEEFKAFLSDIHFHSPQLPVIHNYTGDYSRGNILEIQNNMALQICNPVRWYDSLLCLFNDGVRNFVEVGPGKVLTGLVNKSMPMNYEARVFSINNLKTLEKFINAIQ